MSNEETKVTADETAEVSAENAAAEESAEATAKEQPETFAETSGEAAEQSDASSSANDTVAEESTEKDSSDASDSVEGDKKDSVVETEDSEKPEKTEKHKKTDKRDKRESEKPRGMSKLFKLVYYPVLSLVCLLLLIFSIVDGVYGYKPKSNDGEYFSKVDTHIAALAAMPRSQMNAGGIASAREYIAGVLSNNGFARVDEVKKGEDEEGVKEEDEVITTVTDWATYGNSPAPTVTLFASNMTPSVQALSGSSDFIVGTEISDVVAAIPSEKTRSGENSSAVIITVRYDKRTDTVGATDNAAFVANALQTLVKFVQNDVRLENDLVVVFTEELDHSYGSFAFINSFDGLGDVVSRAKAGLNIDAIGNSGTLALIDSTGAGLSYFNAYTKVSGTTFNSSVVPDSVPDELKPGDAVKAFDGAGVPAVSVAVLGGIDSATSFLDNVDNVNKSVIYQQADFLDEYINYFCSTDKTFEKSDKPLTYFSYFDWGTVAYNSVASYVIGGLLLALIAGTIVAMAVKKTFSVRKMFMAMLAEVCVLIGALAAMYAAYFLVTLMLTGFGAMPIHAITQITHFNAGIFIAAMLIAVAASFGFSSLFKKLFKVTSSDNVRGTAMLFGFVGAIMSFASPKFGFLTVWPGMLLIATLLVTVLLNSKLKQSFGFGFDRLFVFVIPAALCLPVVIAPLAMLTQLLPLIYMPLTMLLFTALIGVIVPYLDRTKSVFDKVAKKLPARTVRVQRVVTERVEDRAKKGKFTEQTVKRVDKEKVAVNYKNYFGVSFLAVIAIVVALFSGGFGIDFGKTLTKPHSYAQSAYNDALVYEWEIDSNGTKTQRVVVDDLIAYKFVRYAVTDLDWDSVNERYVKTVNYNSSDIVSNEPNVTQDGSVYSVRTFDGSFSTVTLKFAAASSISMIKITDSNGAEYVYYFQNCDNIVLRLPYGFGNFTMEIDGSPSAVEYEERESVSATSSNNQLVNITEWNQLRQYYRDSDIANEIRGAIVVKRYIKF